MRPRADGSATVATQMKSLLLALALALLFRSTAVQAYTVPTGSATPTLLTGDSVLVSKFAYGYSRYSLPWAPGFLHGRLFGSAPRRGDMVVFVNPRDGVVTLKRIVGLPGEKIQMVRGILTINGVAARRERIGTYLERDWDEAASAPAESLRYRYRETLPGGLTHEILGTPVSMPEDSLPADDTEVYVVPAGHYFGMGDSRDNSADSRFLNELGYIPAENLIGRVELRLVSFDPGAHAWEVWKYPATLRLERFFGRVR